MDYASFINFGLYSRNELSLVLERLLCAAKTTPTFSLRCFLNYRLVHAKPTCCSESSGPS